MAISLLVQLGLNPQQAAALPAAVRAPLLDFLLRWEAFADALACLAALPHADLPALLDLEAEALRGLGQVDAALAVVDRRLALKDGRPARQQQVQLLLAAGRIDAARRAAAALAAEDAVGTAGNLAGEVELAAGNLDAAEAIFVRQAQRAPQSRAPLLGLVQVHARQSHLVPAAAYAVQAIALAERGPELSVAEMSALRAFFQTTGDANRVRDLNRRLVERFEREQSSLAALLAAPAAPAQQPGRAGWSPAAGAPAVRPAVPAPTISGGTVSDDERRRLTQAALDLFGFPSLLPGQAEVLAASQRGEHVLAILPTGAGKSLCYQLPALQSDRVTLVVSPLIALMKDQVDGLPPALRQYAVALNSSLDGDDLRRASERVAARRYRLVYAAPERLRQLPFVHALRQAGVARMVIDEAHCVSIWGHDFRPDYLHLAHAHQDLGAPPLLAMTATAPPRVRQDIERQLLGRVGTARVITGDTLRPNLHLSALRMRDDDERVEYLVALLRQLKGSGIVYARSRQRCEDLAALLRTQGIVAAHYHAGIPDRTAVQDQFMRGEIPVIVATVAFGMGVDKADVRFIIHVGLPDSVEGYYQEVGRAGRDGAPAHCVLLYADHDRTLLSLLAQRSSLTVETARAFYAALRQQLEGRATGLVDVAAAARVVGGDETAARVMLSLLEQAGLVRRHYDAPRIVTLQRAAMGRQQPPPALVTEFLRRAGLVEASAASSAFLDLAARTGFPAESLEGELLQWQDAGWLRYYPMDRAPLVTLLSAPADATLNVDRLLSRRAAIAAQRIQEIVDYAATAHCRHDYLAAYLGGARRKRCAACDNCGSGAPALPAGFGRDQARSVQVVLQALAEHAWGRRTLVRLLRGDPAAPAQAHESRYYGLLRERSEQSLGQLVDSLTAEQLIQPRVLDHGGVMLELTRQGQALLQRSQHGKKHG